MKSIAKILSLAVLAAFVAAGCKKKEALTLPKEEAHFLFRTGASYQVLTPTTTYKLPVGITTVSDRDRIIEFSVSSPTGAVQGTHYTLNKTAIIIPAGKAIDTITVQGVFTAYQAGRKDTLIFTILEKNGIKPIESNPTFRLFMRGPCFEGDVVLNELLGAYRNTNELFGTSAYGPYTTTISSVRSLTATTGEITVTNIYDFGWNPIKFILDWTDPANRTVTLEQQAGSGNAGTINGAFAGQDISVRAIPGNNGTFSYCNQTLVLVLQPGVTGLGWFTSGGQPLVYRVDMRR
ncbi:MAG TPA: hypothetical protein PKE63_07025 [Lacibacter sp.]|nr:hypothetical protein [Lacibacter sp.]